MSRHAGIQTPVQDRGSSPLLPSDHVLGSGALWFPGVFDQHGCPLIIFPADGQERLLELSKTEVVDFIHYFHALLNKKQEKRSLVSVVADLRQAAPPTTRFITETLLLLEEHKRTVHSVYIIQPKRKDVAKLLLKLLVGSKSCDASFRNILLKEIPELWNSIDRSQLPASLGGYFLYCHHSWVSFMKEIDGFVQEFLSVVQRLPSCISTLQALSRLPLPSSLSQLQHFCSTNEATFLQLRRELGLDELLKHCEAVCEKLRHPDREPCYQAMAGTPFFTQTAFDMLQNHSRITAAVEKVELLWQQAFAKAHLQLQVLQLSNSALQIIVKMESLQEKLQPYRMEMAKDSTTAALLLSEFETSIFTPAMALIRCAEDVIHTLEEISPVKSWHEESWALELERQKENLHSAVRVVLQTLRAVSSCHHYYNKADRWYRLVLSDRFLPELLSGVHEEQQSNSLRTIPAWRQRLSTFLRKNPPPEMEELLHLSCLSTSIPDIEVQQTSRRLSQRCMILRTLLMSSGPVSVEQLQLALQWQYEMLHGNLNSELCLNHSDEDKGSSERANEVCESELEAGSHPAALLSAAVVGPASADWSAQLEASGGKDEVENFQKLTRVSDPTMAAPGQPRKQEEGNFNAPGSEVDGKLDSTLPANFSSASIQIIPKVEAESLNLEIMVKRSAAPPTNPWLSLPVDDLENSYTVTITPKPTPQKKLSPECSGLGGQEGGSSQRFSNTEALSCMKLQHSCEDDPELSPISNVLCSTITDGRETEVPTLLWDSYEEKPEVDGMIDLSLTDWEVKEQENLREVERILNQAGGILEEEENVLAQEAELDALLRDGDGKDLWPQWGSNQQLHQITDFNVPIVLDMGSGLMKAGFANQDLPNVTFPTITGVPKYEEIMSGAVEKELYVGHDAQHMRGVLTLNHPIKNGIICNWEEMEKMWQYTFQQLCVDPEEHPVLLTEAAMNPLENRRRMVEIMFENFGVPLAYVAMQAVLALYAAGRTTGVVFDSGEGVSHSVPVFEGYSLPHAVQRFPLAGLDVTLQLKKLLQEQGVCMRTTAEDEIVREMKEKCCCVALNYEAELNLGSSSCREMQYTMPDGQIVTMGTERFRAPEILFNPDMIGRDHPGIHESIFKSILRSDIDLRRSFLGNIILSGGNTLLPGLPERLQAEVKSLVPADMRVNVCVTSPKDRRFLVWSGGAVLANLSTFNSAWISRGEYEEYGPQIVFRKCF
uniref:CRAL-TRIO domain-containing protein n=1 Tax=Poecilia mexicana TaxID=48701 RepID=A0A3B3X4V9_9TELE